MAAEYATTIRGRYPVRAGRTVRIARHDNGSQIMSGLTG